MLISLSGRGHGVTEMTESSCDAQEGEIDRRNKTVLQTPEAHVDITTAINTCHFGATSRDVFDLTLLTRFCITAHVWYGLIPVVRVDL